jgi:hypothetical protein
VAAVLVGALARTSRAGFQTIMSGDLEVRDSDPPAADRTGNPGLYLPRVSGAAGFSGSTGGVAGLGQAEASAPYLKLAEDIRRADGDDAQVAAVRRVLTSSLGTALAPTDWAGLMQQWGLGALNAAFAAWRRR